MKEFYSIVEWLKERRGLASNTKVGFVPTMGALHAGHASLFQQARLENDIVVASIFVNPTQFDNKMDLAKYPKNLEHDIELLRLNKIDFGLFPTFDELYPDQFRFRVSENAFSQILCGAHRPGHFDGVLTVVLKLINIAGAHRVYFGEKDFQQLKLIEDMVNALFIPCEIRRCPTVRDHDGLALSSRNSLLNPEERKRAAAFPRLLSAQTPPTAVRFELEKLGFAVDYIEDQGGRRFGAVRIGNVRLIDNFAIEHLKPPEVL